MNTNLVSQAIPLIIQWYKENERPLPWRSRPADPYRVWISEIMLQQTRIEAVIPFYHRFLERLPNVKALSLVEDDELMKLWEGLGYYSRARNLKKAAVQLMEDHNGNLPQTASQLEKLPGIGAYTAGAISSISFGEPSPAVDGNVLRVLSRLTASDMDVSLDKTKKDVTRALLPLYPAGENASFLTQGLMELGEVICIPNGLPNCERCPVRSLCLSRLQNTTDKYPIKTAKKERRIERRIILLLEHDGRFALRKRPSKGLLASMLEFPSIEEGESVSSFLSTHQLTALNTSDYGSAVHVFSHVEWHMRGIRILCKEKNDSFRWHTIQEIQSEIALPTAFRFFRNSLA